MNSQRLVIIVVTLSLIVIAAFALRTSIATSAVAFVGHGDYDEVERGRVNFGKAPADSSYDQVERTRAQFQPSKSAEASYDQAERARAELQLGRPSGGSGRPDLSDYALRHPELLHAAGNHTLRDEIPSEFIYPLAPGTSQDSASLARVRAKIPSDFIQPVVPYGPDEFAQPATPQSLRDAIPSDFIYPVTAESGG